MKYSELRSGDMFINRSDSFFVIKSDENGVTWVRTSDFTKISQLYTVSNKGYELSDDYVVIRGSHVVQ